VEEREHRAGGGSAGQHCGGSQHGDAYEVRAAFHGAVILPSAVHAALLVKVVARYVDYELQLHSGIAQSCSPITRSRDPDWSVRDDDPREASDAVVAQLFGPEAHRTPTPR